MPNRIVAVRWKRKVYLIEEHFRNGERCWYWEAGTCGWMPWPKGTKILKEYDPNSDVFAEFYKDFPILPSKPKPTAGWLSPSGDFYSCSSYEHIAIGSSIALSVYGDGDSIELEKKGWLHIYSDGIVTYRCDESDVTQKQVDTLFDLAVSAKHVRPRMKTYEKNILQTIENITEMKTLINGKS